MTACIRRTKLAGIGIGIGYRVLTPDGLSPTVSQVRWCDAGGNIVIIRWANGRQVEAAGAQEIHAVTCSEASVVTSHQLAVAPRPIWTGTFPEEILRLAWQAHLAGDSHTVVLELARLNAEDAIRRPAVWPIIASCLALYAFAFDALGQHEQAISIADGLAAKWKAWDPRAHTPVAIRRRLASPLPTSTTARLHESLQRWALATAYRLPSAKHQVAHYRDLNRVRSASERRAAAQARPEQVRPA